MGEPEELQQIQQSQANVHIVQLKVAVHMKKEVIPHSIRDSESRPLDPSTSMSLEEIFEDLTVLIEQRTEILASVGYGPQSVDGNNFRILWEKLYEKAEECIGATQSSATSSSSENIEIPKSSQESEEDLSSEKESKSNITVPSKHNITANNASVDDVESKLADMAQQIIAKDSGEIDQNVETENNTINESVSREINAESADESKTGIPTDEQAESPKHSKDSGPKSEDQITIKLNTAHSPNLKTAHIQETQNGEVKREGKVDIQQQSKTEPTKSSDGSARNKSQSKKESKSSTDYDASSETSGSKKESDENAEVSAGNKPDSKDEASADDSSGNKPESRDGSHQEVAELKKKN